MSEVIQETQQEFWRPPSPVVGGDIVVHDGRIWHRVAMSPYKGAASRRRVMYIPVIIGKYMPKNEDSTTPFYHHFLKLVK